MVVGEVLARTQRVSSHERQPRLTKLAVQRSKLNNVKCLKLQLGCRLVFIDSSCLTGDTSHFNGTCSIMEKWISHSSWKRKALPSGRSMAQMRISSVAGTLRDTSAPETNWNRSGHSGLLQLANLQDVLNKQSTSHHLRRLIVYGELEPVHSPCVMVKLWSALSLISGWEDWRSSRLLVSRD